MVILKDFIIIFCTIFSTMMFSRYNAKMLLPCAILLSLILTMKFFEFETKIKNNTELAQKKLQLQRDKFLNSLTHDLRIPIIAQLRALELFNNGTLGQLNPTQQEFAAQSVHSCRCILDLITLLINGYKIENSEHQFMYERFNIIELVRLCFDELADEASEKNITFEYKCESKELFITADREELKNVIYNLIFTSIIHSPVEAKISIDISIIENKIRLLIFGQDGVDYGKICEQNSDFTTIGQNIRLNYCKKIIETHHGRILESENNKGLFIFEIPRTINS